MNTTDTAEIHQKAFIENEIVPAFDQAVSMTITNTSELAAAKTFLAWVKEQKNIIEEKYAPTAKKNRAYKVYQDALENEKFAYAKADKIIEIITTKGKMFNTQEAIRIQREAEAIRAEEDRKERKRQAEIQAKIYEENRKIQASNDEEAKRKAAMKIEKLTEKMEAAPTPVFTPPPEATKKLTTKANILSVFKVCKLITDGVIPFNVLEVSQVNLNNWAKAQDVKAKFDGIELFATTTRI